MLCANCPEASYRMEAVNRATVALLLLCAVIPSARTSCGGNCVSAREEDKSVATQQITVSCPQADRCGEVRDATIMTALALNAGINANPIERNWLL